MLLDIYMIVKIFKRVKVLNKYQINKYQSCFYEGCHTLPGKPLGDLDLSRLFVSCSMSWL